MGEPAWSNVHALPPEYIGRVETTGGTETSKYLEEKKSTEIPLVVASERGRGQTRGSNTFGVRTAHGMEGI